MKKILLLLAAASVILSSCASSKHTTNYVVNNIPVEIIDGQEYFVQRDTDGKITMMTPKVDESKKDKKTTALIATTGVSAGLSLIAIFVTMATTFGARK